MRQKTSPTSASEGFPPEVAIVYDQHDPSGATSANAPAASDVQGPFANWSSNAANGGGVPPGYAPLPPFSQQPTDPLMSDSTRTFFRVLVLTVLLGGTLLAGNLLFQQAYDQSKKTGAALAIEALNIEGEKLYNSGNYDAAVDKYRQAFAKGKGLEAGDKAKSNLVVVYNKAGLVAFQRSENRKAEDYWFAALEVDPNNEDANYNLGKLYERIGDKDQALREWRQSSGAGGGRITSPDPSTPGNNSVLQNRAQNAMNYYNQGMEALRHGDQDKARELWTQAIGEAPGTDAAQKAKQALEDTPSQPNFGG